ncbi:hypothetical protein L195_g043366 [Trifolium pratense]|uniref:Uncharacterized protein n=1 Tax=Trifolium pratense TaxID=57577 RepID=A0A2K3M939_TRIPR|nr:hypothetical protein L195_g043366 [Trifolium pratense]
MYSYRHKAGTLDEQINAIKWLSDNGRGVMKSSECSSFRCRPLRKARLPKPLTRDERSWAFNIWVMLNG